MNWRLTFLGFICFACASSGDQDINFTQGNGSGSGNAMPTGGQSQPVYPNCTGDVYCYENEQCDLTRGVCVPADSPNGLQSDASIGGNPIDEADQGFMGSEDMVDPSMGDGACRTPSDVAFFQQELICTETCDETYETAQARCQQTPSRIADCLAEASEERVVCLDMCEGIGSTVTNCLSRCNDLLTVGECGLTCLRLTYGFSDACGGCFVELFECGANFCQSVCVSGESDTCSGCLANSCGRDFESCAAMMLPQ